MTLYSFYWWLSNKEWPVWCIYPSIMNIACPDASVRYYLMSFLANAGEIRITNLPLISKSSPIIYWSLVWYDTYGLVLHQMNDTHNTNDFVTYTPTCTCCLLLRYYMRSSHSNIEFLPKVTVSGRSLLQDNVENIVKRSNRIEKIVQTISRWRSWKFLYDTIDFIHVDKSKMQGIFPNPDATYFIYLLRQDDKCIHLVTHSMYSSCTRFIGMMICDLSTTETIMATPSFTNTITHVYIAQSEIIAKKYGYETQNHHLLVWNPHTVRIPIIVYRRIDTESSSHDSGIHIIAKY